MEVLLTYLNMKKLRKNVICGFNLSCVGDEKLFFISTKNTLADKSIKAALIGKIM